MEPADSIGRLGFGRWYERQLIQSHAYLVTCFLCIVAVASCYEVAGAYASRFEHFLIALVVLVIGALGVHSLGRYRVLLLRAETIARRATCKTCETYGRITVVESGSSETEPAGDERIPWIRVRCRKCGNAWTID